MPLRSLYPATILLMCGSQSHEVQEKEERVVPDVWNCWHIVCHL